MNGRHRPKPVRPSAAGSDPRIWRQRMAVPAAPSDTREQELVDQAVDWLNVNVAKLIMVRLVPLIMASGVVTVGLAWLQEELGLNLPPSVVSAWVGAVILGVAGIVLTYIRNHGQGAAHLAGKVLDMVAAGERPTVVNLPGVVAVTEAPPGVLDSEGGPAR